MVPRDGQRKSLSDAFDGKALGLNPLADRSFASQPFFELKNRLIFTQLLSCSFLMPKTIVEQLTDLAALKAAGVLSEEEFNTAKQRVLGGGGAASAPVTAQATVIPVVVTAKNAAYTANPVPQMAVAHATPVGPISAQMGVAQMHQPMPFSAINGDNVNSTHTRPVVNQALGQALGGGVNQFGVIAPCPPLLLYEDKEHGVKFTRKLSSDGSMCMNIIISNVFMVAVVVFCFSFPSILSAIMKDAAKKSISSSSSSGVCAGPRNYRSPTRSPTGYPTAVFDPTVYTAAPTTPFPTVFMEVSRDPEFCWFHWLFMGIGTLFGIFFVVPSVWTMLMFVRCWHTHTHTHTTHTPRSFYTHTPAHACIHSARASSLTPSPSFSFSSSFVAPFLVFSSLTRS
tara:strand:- start:290 stop:1480 length:1191 start_codon:yes stop_codon:yes gene_type:complete